MTDAMVGEVIARLKQEGVLDNTIVLFMTDHGISHARGKQFLYEEGIHVPLVIAGPGIEPGTVREDLVEHIDIAALSLVAAGITVPPWMQAHDILADDYQLRAAVFSARDRCDETVDHIRAVRTKDFKYIRNFLHQRPYLQPNAYKDSKQIIIALREWHEAGKLNEPQSDPHEINNLANDPEYADKLAELRERLETWMEETGDLGREPESWEMYDSDMALYRAKRRRRGDPNALTELEANIDLMKKWAAEGK